MNTILIKVERRGDMIIATSEDIDGFLIMERDNDDMLVSIGKVVPMFYKAKNKYVKVEDISWENVGGIEGEGIKVSLIPSDG